MRKILRLYTPNEALYAVSHTAVSRSEYYVSKVEYLALCDDGRIHPMELVGGGYVFCDRYGDFMGYFNETGFRKMYETVKGRKGSTTWIMGDYEIEEHEW